MCQLGLKLKFGIFSKNKKRRKNISNLYFASTNAIVAENETLYICHAVFIQQAELPKCSTEETFYKSKYRN
jgi:hypothetical protein